MRNVCFNFVIFYKRSSELPSLVSSRTTHQSPVGFNCDPNDGNEIS